MPFEVLIVNDCEMPPGHNWVRFDFKDGRTLICFRSSVVNHQPPEGSRTELERARDRVLMRQANSAQAALEAVNLPAPRSAHG